MDQWGQVPSAHVIAWIVGWDIFVTIACLCVAALGLWGFFSKRIPFNRSKECRTSWVGRYHFSMLGIAIAPLIYTGFLVWDLSTIGHDKYRFLFLDSRLPFFILAFLIMFASTSWPVKCVPAPQPDPVTAETESDSQSPYLGPRRGPGVRTLADIQRDAGRFGEG